MMLRIIILSYRNGTFLVRAKSKTNNILLQYLIFKDNFINNIFFLFQKIPADELVIHSEYNPLEEEEEEGPSLQNNHENIQKLEESPVNHKDIAAEASAKPKLSDFYKQFIKKRNKGVGNNHEMTISSVKGASDHY